jgi:hypothetical protein
MQSAAPYEPRLCCRRALFPELERSCPLSCRLPETSFPLGRWGGVGSYLLRRSPPLWSFYPERDFNSKNSNNCMLTYAFCKLRQQISFIFSHRKIMAAGFILDVAKKLKLVLRPAKVKHYIGRVKRQSREPLLKTSIQRHLSCSSGSRFEKQPY